MDKKKSPFSKELTEMMDAHSRLGEKILKGHGYYGGDLSPEKQALSSALESFNSQQEKLLHDKADEGYTGWDTMDQITIVRHMHDDITRIFFKKDNTNISKLCLDIANRAMMLWNREKNNDN